MPGTREREPRAAAWPPDDPVAGEIRDGRVDAGEAGPDAQGLRFEGSTLEAALTEAVKRVGPDCQVADARRIRTGGVLGFFARERFEVEIEPGPPPPAAGEAETHQPAAGRPSPTPADQPPSPASASDQQVKERLDDTLRGLVARVEADEAASGADVAPPIDDDLPTFEEMLFGAGWDAEPEPAPEADGARPGDDTAGAHEPVDSIDGRPRAVTPPWALLEAGPAAPPAQPAPDLSPAGAPNPPEADHDADAPASDPQWSVFNLVELGVPEAIVDRLRRLELRGDAVWTMQLASAIAELVPPPVADADDGEVVASGRGIRSAIQILRAGVAGIPPGRITIDGRPARATALELAIAVRACLPR